MSGKIRRKQNINFHTLRLFFVGKFRTRPDLVVSLGHASLAFLSYLSLGGSQDCNEPARLPRLWPPMCRSRRGLSSVRQLLSRPKISAENRSHGLGDNDRVWGHSRMGRLCAIRRRRARFYFLCPRRNWPILPLDHSLIHLSRSSFDAFEHRALKCAHKRKCYV